MTGAAQADRRRPEHVRRLRPQARRTHRRHALRRRLEPAELSPHDRSLITVAVLSAGENTEQLGSHLGRALEMA
jgi:alkylhydroperoxidase/carboxymuconolactone decarboxylase family protein YurZ